MSEEALQVDEERREVKTMKDRERYTQLNVELQIIPRRDKKALFKNKCKKKKKKEGNNIMRKAKIFS